MCTFLEPSGGNGDRGPRLRDVVPKRPARGIFEIYILGSIHGDGGDSETITAIEINLHFETAVKYVAREESGKKRAYVANVRLATTQADFLLRFA